MRRRLLTLAIFLLAGAVVNVAVAWAITAVPKWRRETTVARKVEWPHPVPKHWPQRAIRLQGGAFGWRHDQYSAILMGFTDNGAQWVDGRFIIIIASAGWPCRALQSENWTDWVVSWEPGVSGNYRFDGQPRRTWWLSGIIPPVNVFGFGPQKTSAVKAPHWSLVGSDKTLPVRPVWTGFAVNTIFYAALLWLPFAPFTLRRLIRRRRGLCPACAYDLRHGEHEACPECGRALPRHDDVV